MAGEKIFQCHHCPMYIWRAGRKLHLQAKWSYALYAYKMAFYYCSFLWCTFTFGDQWTIVDAWQTCYESFWCFNIRTFESIHLWSSWMLWIVSQTVRKNYAVYWTLIVTIEQKQTVHSWNIWWTVNVNEKEKKMNFTLKESVQFYPQLHIYLTAIFHCDFPFLSVEVHVLLSIFSIPKHSKRQRLLFWLQIFPTLLSLSRSLVRSISLSVTLHWFILLPFTVAAESNPELCSVRNFSHRFKYIREMVDFVGWYIQPHANLRTNDFVIYINAFVVLVQHFLIIVQSHTSFANDRHKCVLTYCCLLLCTCFLHTELIFYTKSDLPKMYIKWNR